MTADLRAGTTTAGLPGEPARPRRWTLPTATSVYVLEEAPDGLGPVLAGWGPPGAGRPTGARPRYWETGADMLPLEYTAAGTRQSHLSELLVRRDSGVDGARLRLVPGSVKRVHHDGDSHVHWVLRDERGGVEVESHVRTSTDHDVVERWVHIRATGGETVELTRAFSAAWNIPVGPGARIDALGGRWAREFTEFAVELSAGAFTIGSREGITSHTWSPVVALRHRVGAADEHGHQGHDGDGEIFGIALAWSGSWRLQVEAVPFEHVVRVSGGVDDETCVLTLAPGEEFVTPSMLGVRSSAGPDGLARSWHHYQRTVLSRGAEARYRPIVYNSWYATRFDVTVEHQLDLAVIAADLGVETFVVDDGWFAGRTDDTAGLGDWTADARKFPDGLTPLVDGVRALGMRFGLWIEPEAVNPDSDLYRAHPDWVYRAGDRPLTTRRNQYVLDLGRPEVEEWAAGVLRRLLTEHPITFLKWDMNRTVSDGGRPGDPHGREWSIQHARAYHRLLQLIRSEFPQVTVEACAGGGGRIDNAVLAASDVVWTSDETGPRGRLGIQHGFLGAYPPSVMSSWVTDEPDLVDECDPGVTAPTSLEFRFVVAMAGVLGLGADLLAWDGPTRDRARELVGRYRGIRSVIHGGTVTRHGNPHDPAYAVQYTGTGADAGRVIVLAWCRPGTHRAPFMVRLHDLPRGSRYRVRDRGGEVRAEDQQRSGLPIEFTLAADCDVVVLDRIDA